MKIYAINGSPRKNWNSAKLLDSFIDGIRSIEPDAEINTVHTYDLNYTGCRSCFGCKLLTSKPLECLIKDDIHDILIDIRNSDGLVVSSPIYFLDLSAQVKAFLERLMYPGASNRPLCSTFMYSMNATQELMDQYIRPQINCTRNYMTSNFLYEPKEVFSFDTYQRDNNELYRKGHTDMEAKKIHHEKQFPIDCKNAFDAGVELVNNIKNMRREKHG